MSAVPDITQRLETPLLDLVEDGRSPAWIGRYTVGNRLGRSLSHLAATTGRFSRLLRCDADGILQVAMVSGAGGTPAAADANGNMYTTVRSGTDAAEVLAASAPNTGTVGIAVSNSYLANLYSGLVTNRGPLKLVDTAGSNELVIDANGALVTQIYDGANYPDVRDANNVGTGDSGLCVSNVYLKDIYDILYDVWDQSSHALTTIAS